MGGDSWAARTAAVEGSYFRAEQQQAMRKHLEKMVVDGKLPASALSDPNTLYRARSTLPEHQLKFKHTKAEFPTLSRSLVHDWKLGCQVSFGPARWANGEANIWDVKAAREMAQAPSKQATWAEEIRLRKIAQAQYESPIVRGYRLLPQFTPGKAFFWGTVLSVWGVAMSTVLVSKVCGISMDNIPEKVREAGEPLKQKLKEHLEPLKATLSATSSSRTGDAFKAHETPEIFQKLKALYTR